jgi:alpha-ketoglutaric semialdehyde dehydrogenase
MITGKHLIAGEWIATKERFRSDPASGESQSYSIGTPELVDQAVAAAEEAFWSFGYLPRAERAEFLRTIADEIENRADAITAIGSAETGLPEARLNGERGRTTGQLRLFAELIEQDDHFDLRHHEAIPDRQPAPRPDLKLMQRPIGPVAVFGASNFPLAFSTAGGDTASALAAGCPVVMKGHPAHPGTGELVAQAIDKAIQTIGLPGGVFSFVQGNTHAFAQALVKHPLIRAVGFTGSLFGGRTLFDLCAARPEPIPFYGELGSVNPMFLLPGAIGERGEAIAKGWIASLTLGAGQFCTNPGLVIVVKGAEADRFIEAATTAIGPVGAQTMLTDGIASAFRKGRDAIAGTEGVKELAASACEGRSASPHLYRVSGKDWLESHVLSEEVFGPLGLVVEVDDTDEMIAIARALKGQLVCSLHLSDSDGALAKRLMPILERKAGRILANGYPTGVEVSSAMVHGGPYPATTNFGHTSVGTLSIRRWLRPVCFQDMPESLLPGDWTMPG